MVWWLGAVCPVVDGPAAHADHVLLSIVDGLDTDLVCTHVDRGEVVARTRMTARLRREPSPADVVALAERLGEVALDDSAAPEGARFIRFPGQNQLTGVLTAGEVVARSAIDEVAGIGTLVEPETPIDTCGFLRPTLTNGRLVLLVEPAAGGALRPVEIANPHECCGGH